MLLNSIAKFFEEYPGLSWITSSGFAALVMSLLRDESKIPFGVKFRRSIICSMLTVAWSLTLHNAFDIDWVYSVGVGVFFGYFGISIVDKLLIFFGMYIKDILNELKSSITNMIQRKLGNK